MLLKFVGPISKTLEMPQFVVDKFNRLTTIKEIREEISPLFKYQPNDMRLLCRGKELVDECNLYEFGVKDGDTVHVTIKQKQIRTDVNCNETLSSGSVSPKSVTSDDSLNEIEVASKFYRVGDKVDILCDESDAWFEGTIVKITQKSVPESSLVAINDGKATVNRSAGSNNDLNQVLTDNLAYHCTYDFCGNLSDVVNLDRLAPRACKKASFEKVNVGDNVLLNYNVDVPGELGDWYRALITSKVVGRNREALIATLFIGRERANLEKCKVKKIDEIYFYDETRLLTDRNVNELPREYVKRTTRQCVWCHDNPSKNCLHCKCVICGSSEDEANTILCEECDEAYHIYCLKPALNVIPEDEWYCPDCKTDDSSVVKAGEKVKMSKRMSEMPGIKNKHKRNWDQGHACKGPSKQCTKVPIDHIGPIPGVEVGTCWQYRWQVCEEGVHRPIVAGIHGRPKDGAFSIVVSGGYEDDVDKGDEITYTGSGGRDLSGNKRTANQSKEQDFTRGNLALAKSCHCTVSKNGGDAGDKWKKGKAVRVLRSAKAHIKGHSKYAPKLGCRYDGIYKVVKYWHEEGKGGHNVYRFMLRRDDEVPAPWTKEGKKRVEELGLDNVIVPTETQLAERKAASGNGDDEETPAKRAKKYLVAKPVLKHISSDVANEKIWNDCLSKCENGQRAFFDATEEAFNCIICASLMVNPVTLPCSHSICQTCLKRSFDADIFSCSTCRFELGKNFEMTINESLNNSLKAIFPGYVK